MIIVRHIEGRRSERVPWLCEELNVPYELDFIQGDIVASLLALENHHEMRMTPIVEIDGVVMIESGAILEYILSRYGKGSSLRPAEDSKAFPAYLQFLHFAEGTAMSMLIQGGVSAALEAEQKKAGTFQESPYKLTGLAASRTRAERIIHFAENTLAKQPYFAGDTFTAADIMMHFPLKFGVPQASNLPLTISEMYSTTGAHWDAFPHVKSFVERVMERPAFKRAMKACMPKGPPTI